MKKKPDWYKSRTFWTGFVTSVIMIVGGNEEHVSQYVDFVLSIIPYVLILLGVTEREGAQQVK